MIALLTNPVFLVAAIGSVLLSCSAAAIGSLSVLKGQSLIGDALGNAAFPGVVLAFMLFESRNPLLLVTGAAITGCLGFLYIQFLVGKTKISFDSALAIVLSSFFGLGMVLKSHISGNPDYAGASQAGLQNYIFGQASYIMKSDIYVICIVSLIALALLIAFYKEIKLNIFDATISEVYGYPTRIINIVILISTLFLVAVGLKVVGAILISAMLITPCVSAQKWVHSFKGLLILSGIFGGVSAFVGVGIATYFDGLATGPCIIVCMSIICFVSLIKGALSK